MEGLDNLLQCLGRRVEVIGVELYGKAPAAVVVDGLVPAAAYAEIRALWDDMYKTLIVEGLQQFRGLV